MNYYKPLELQGEKPEDHTGYWRFTRTNDDVTYAIGYCLERRCLHKTPEEACDCFRTYLKEQCEGRMFGGFPMNEEWGTEMRITSSF